MPGTDQVSNGWERHVQSLVLALLLAIMLWTGKTLVDVDKRSAVIEESVSALKLQVSSAYSQASATRDQNELTRRLDKMEARMDRYEQSQRNGGSR